MAGGGISYYRYADTTTASSGGTSCYDTTTATSDTSYLYRQVIITKTILVPKPDKWTEEQNLRFVNLVNKETTTTGCKIKMIIKGEILVTDPNVEKRSMTDFIPLLVDQASYTDTQKIYKFFLDNPLSDKDPYKE